MDPLLTRLTYSRTVPIRHPEDVARIRKVLARWGYAASDPDIQDAYHAWSEDNWCAGWLALPEDDDALRRVVQEVIEDYLGVEAE